MTASFFDLIDSAMRDTAALSLPAFRTELAICATIVVMLLCAPVSRRAVDRRRIDCVGWRARRAMVRPAVESAGVAAGRRPRRAARDLHRHVGLRLVHALLPRAVDVLRGAVRAVHAAFGHSRSRGRARLLHARAWRHAGHVHHGVGESFVDDLSGRRDGQRSFLRPGRNVEGAAAKQRGRAEIFRLRSWQPPA